MELSFDHLACVCVARSSPHASPHHGLDCVEVIEPVRLPLATGARRVRTVLVEVGDHVLRDLQVLGVAPPTGVLDTEGERRDTSALCQRSAVLCAQDVGAEKLAPLATAAVLADEHVPHRLLLLKRRRRRERLWKNLTMAFCAKTASSAC